MKISQNDRWKEIPGYEGYYKINTLGIVKGINRVIKHSTGSDKVWKGKYILQSSNEAGYQMVSLAKQGKITQSLIHRLVAQTFIPNPENKPCVNHLNGIKSDNFIDNLAWCTYSENELHSYRVLGKKSVLNRLGKIPHNAKYVGMFNKDTGKLINTYRTATEAAKHIGGNQSRVSTNCRSEQPFCYGYNYKYITEDIYIQYKDNKKEVSKMRRTEYAEKETKHGKTYACYSLDYQYTLGI